MKRWKRGSVLLVGTLLLTATVGFAAGLATPGGLLTHAGPFTQSQYVVDSATGKGTGGAVVEQFMTKSSDTLNIGDVVAVCAINIVCKDTTRAVRNKVIGVVIGGYSSSFRVATVVGDTSTRASLPSRWVYVLRVGRTYCLAGGAIPPGSPIRMDTLTKGRGIVADTTEKAQRVYATAIDSGISGKSVLCDVRK